MRAVIYARYSTDFQSAASWKTRCGFVRSVSPGRAGNWFRYFRTGRSAAPRALVQGIKLCWQAREMGAFDVVVAEALDRLSRDQEDVAGLFKRLRFAGVTIVYPA